MIVRRLKWHYALILGLCILISTTLHELSENVFQSSHFPILLYLLGIRLLFTVFFKDYVYSVFGYESATVISKNTFKGLYTTIKFDSILFYFDRLK